MSDTIDSKQSMLGGVAASLQRKLAGVGAGFPQPCLHTPSRPHYPEPDGILTACTPCHWLSPASTGKRLCEQVIDAVEPGRRRSAGTERTWRRRDG